MKTIEVPICFGSISVFSGQSRAENDCQSCPFENSCKQFYVKTKAEIKLQVEQDKQYLERFKVEE